MKYFALILLIFCMILSGCGRNGAAEERSLDAEVARIEAALGGPQRFVRADEDFTTNNFGKGVNGPGAVFFEEDGIGEWGVFVVSDAAKSAALKTQLREYLDTQKNAVRSLADLYPGDELQERLSLFENASVGGEGGLVWYFALSEHDRALAEQAMQK